MIDVKILYNDGRICISCDTSYNERLNKHVSVFQIQEFGDVLYRGFDTNEIKRIRYERGRKHR